ncbi:MAG: ParA family protein [Cyanobacteria bacterium P01_D01_bin.36]
MADKHLIAVTGDKGGVGKSTLAALTAEWFLYHDKTVHVVDADPNQTTKTWVDKCAELGRQINVDSAEMTIVDTAGTSGSSLTQYIRKADLILVPFKPHVADLEVIVGWFLSLKDVLQERVLFIPNMLSRTKEQREGYQALTDAVEEEGRGRIISGLVHRDAVYPPFLNGSTQNFFAGKLDKKTRQEVESLFQEITAEL